LRRVANRLLFVLVVFSQIKPALAFPGGGEKIRIEHVTPRLVNRHIAVSAEFANLFSDKIVSTIRSGLRSVIQIEIQLRSDLQKELFHKRILRTISYDIWEQRYAVSSADTTLFVTAFDEAKRLGSRLDDESLMPIEEWNGSGKFFIRMKVGINPISTRQAERASDWLLDPNQEQEYLASENRSSTFEVNLNRLVSFFISSRKQSDYISDWFVSPAFRISDLPK